MGQSSPLAPRSGASCSVAFRHGDEVKVAGLSVPHLSTCTQRHTQARHLHASITSRFLRRRLGLGTRASWWPRCDALAFPPDDPMCSRCESLLRSQRRAGEWTWPLPQKGGQAEAEQSRVESGHSGSHHRGPVGPFFPEFSDSNCHCITRT